MRVVVNYAYSTLLSSTLPYPVFCHLLPNVCLETQCSHFPSPYSWDVTNCHTLRSFEWKGYINHLDISWWVLFAFWSHALLWVQKFFYISSWKWTSIMLGSDSTRELPLFWYEGLTWHRSWFWMEVSAVFPLPNNHLPSHSEQLCAFCYCGERSSLGQGDLKQFSPTPGYVIPWKNQPLNKSDASDSADGACERTPKQNSVPRKQRGQKK